MISADLHLAQIALEGMPLEEYSLDPMALDELPSAQLPLEQISLDGMALVHRPLGQIPLVEHMPLEQTSMAEESVELVRSPAQSYMDCVISRKLPWDYFVSCSNSWRKYLLQHHIVYMPN